MRNLIAVALLMMFSVAGFARSATNFIITGEIRSFDTKIVTVQTSPSRKLILPRSSIAANFTLQSSHEWQRIPVLVTHRNQIKEIRIPLLAAENNLKSISSIQLLSDLKKDIIEAKSKNY
jgi:hypothetical protein